LLELDTLIKKIFKFHNRQKQTTGTKSVPVVYKFTKLNN